jgi:hypothetical protein
MAYFELARTLDDIARTMNDPAIRAAAAAAGEASVELARNPVESHLRNVVINGIRQQLLNSSPTPEYPLPPT